jgi:hypothetical protein
MQVPRFLASIPGLCFLGATAQQSIDSSSTSPADLKNDGLSFSWKIRDKKVEGKCHANGKGTISAFKQDLN